MNATQTKTRVLLRNTFHNTECDIHVVLGKRLTSKQMSHIRNTLCPSYEHGCTCGDGLGLRGPQDWDVRAVSVGKYVIDVKGAANE